MRGPHEQQRYSQARSVALGAQIQPSWPLARPGWGGAGGMGQGRQRCSPGIEGVALNSTQDPLLGGTCCVDSGPFLNPSPNDRR